MSVISNNVLAGAAGSGGAGGYTIDNSLRFNDADQAYLSYVPSAAGNRKTFTYSFWIKRTKPDGAATQRIFHCGPYTAPDYKHFHIRFSYDQIESISYDNNAIQFAYTANPRLRDPSAWYHVILSVDTTQAVATDRVKLYVNGELQTYASANDPAQNIDLVPNSASENNYIGARDNLSSEFLPAYLADVHFIDGQALAPTDFGEFDADTGVWNPIEYTGTYGTNGFHLDFSDNSTASALGTDASPNGNNWTVNNMSVTTGNGNWISQVQGTSYSTTYGIPQMFDDNASSECLLTQSSNLTWNIPGGLAFTTSFEVEAYDTGSGEITFNWSGGSYTYSLPNSSAGLVDISANLTSPITSITWSQGNDIQGPYVRQWVIDGVRLVDNSFGKDNDFLLDSPTNGDNTLDTGLGGELSGNYCTWNPISKYQNSASIKPQNGNLEVAETSSGYAGTISGTIAIPKTGKWYWEVGCNTSNFSSILAGVETAPQVNYAGSDNGASLPLYAGGSVYAVSPITLNSPAPSWSIPSSSSDIFGFAVDMDAGELYLYYNGTIQNGGNFIVNNLDLVTEPLFPSMNSHSGSRSITNFGQRPFSYPAPSGYKCLCTANLPDPDIADGSTAFDIALYGGGASSYTISGLSFSPDLVWSKRRDALGRPAVADTVRGATKQISPDRTEAEITITDGLEQFNSDGYVVGTDATEVGWNAGAGSSFVNWIWDGGTAFSNSAGTNGADIASAGYANQNAGFSIVKWTSITWTGSAANRQVYHGLGNAPAFIITKGLDNAASWYCYHKDLDASNPEDWYITLNNTNARGNLADSWGPNKPDSTTFGDRLLGWSAGQDVIAYCWAPVEGYSAFGKFIGNAAANGPFVYTGFRPKLIITKAYGATSSWGMWDTERDTYNAADATLYPNSNSSEETSGAYPFDILSNGFKVRNSASFINSTSGVIYMAWAENPFKTARAR